MKTLTFVLNTVFIIEHDWYIPAFFSPYFSNDGRFLLYGRVKLNAVFFGTGLNFAWTSDIQANISISCLTVVLANVIVGK